MPTVTVNEQKIYYEKLGKGTPLLLLHGWMQVGHELIPLARELAKDYQVFLPDLPGYGRSVPPYRTFSPDFYQKDAAQMSALLDVVGIKNAHILGYSDGGETALLIGVTRPDLCRSIVTWGAVGYFDAHLVEHIHRVILPMFITRAQRTLHPKQDITEWPVQWVTAFEAVVAAGGNLSLSHAAAMKCPLLLMVGEQDTLNPAETGRRFVDTVHQANLKGNHQFRLFAQTGHAIHEERPVQFVETVRDFLQQY